MTSTGEQHPVYEEFGIVLLFILLVHQRFGLGDDELGIYTAGSFVLRYLHQGFAGKSLITLSDSEKRHLKDWVKGLFESEGISDELMSRCSPQDFHLLSATLFDQSLNACQSGVLSVPTMRGGFEGE